MMQKLNLPHAVIKIKEMNSKTYVFDKLRRKYLVLTPEEWVRQHFIHFLINRQGVPEGLIALEKGLKVNSMPKRTDIVVYSKQGSPILIVECKAASVRIDQKVFEQIARYNMSLKVPFLIVSNGLQTYSCLINHASRDFRFLREVPSFQQMEHLQTEI